LILTFFGLRIEHKPIIHQQIFEIIYYGNGGFNWLDVYNMPVWLRKFYFKKIEEARQAAHAKADPATSKKPIVTRPAIHQP
jgi:hypothetical protein